MLFKNKKVFLPVIHVEHAENTYKNIEIAIKAKFDEYKVVELSNLTHGE